ALGEPVACRTSCVGRIDETGGDDRRAELREPLLQAPLVALEPLAQPFELRPVRGEPDREDADPRSSVPAHRASACAACRRAAALRSRSRARRYISPAFGMITLASRR